MEDGNMRRPTMLKNIVLSAFASLCLTSCNLIWQIDEDIDVHKSIKFAGQWTGDFGMYYYYRYQGYTYTFDSYDTDIVFYPEHDGATYGWGKQVDYYEEGPYTYIYNSFDWEIRHGVIYLRYYSDISLDCSIHDYEMTTETFRGRFDGSTTRFCLSKIADYYDWTAYVDYYFFYRNNNWVCSPRHARDVNPKDNAGNNSAYEYNEKTGSETEGIMGFGKRL